MRRQWLIAVSLLFAFGFLSLNIVSSQSQPGQSQPGQSGMINGTVKDPNGAVVAGAQITVRNESTGETRNATTNNEGRFKIEALAPGRYVVSVARSGFKTADRNVSIDGGRIETVEIKLDIAEARAEVSVGANFYRPSSARWPSASSRATANLRSLRLSI